MSQQSSGEGRVRVWDPFVRLFHWSLVVAFAIAYTTEDDTLAIHVWAGYIAGGLVLARIPWGFVGPRYARFADFLCGPAAALRYLVDLPRGRAPRHLGHSPAGGVMVMLLMAGVLVTVWTGLELYAAEEGRGPLAGGVPVIAQALADGDDDDDRGRRGRERGEDGAGEVWEDLHEWIAHLTFLAVLFHIGGVVLAGVMHRENLVRAMVTGFKRPE